MLSFQRLPPWSTGNAQVHATVAVNLHDHADVNVNVNVETIHEVASTRTVRISGQPLLRRANQQKPCARIR